MYTATLQGRGGGGDAGGWKGDGCAIGSLQRDCGVTRDKSLRAGRQGSVEIDNLLGEGRGETRRENVSLVSDNVSLLSHAGCG